MKGQLRLDHVAATLRLDASETVYLERQLLEVRSSVFEVRYPDLKGMAFVPPETQRINPGATHFTYSYNDHVGEAALASDLSRRGPRVDIKRTEATPIKLQSMTTSYGYSLQEIRSAMMAGYDLDGGKARAARDAIERKRDNILLVGDGTATYFGLTGLFKLSGTHTYTVPNGAGGSPLWVNKTPDEIIRDMHGICNGIVTNSNELENPNTLILPLTSYTHVATQRMGDGATDMILDFFLKTRRAMRPGFSVETSIKLETAGAGNGTRMVAYEKNPAKVARLDPIEFEQLPPQVVGFETLIECHARLGGCFAYFPKSISFGDGI